MAHRTSGTTWALRSGIVIEHHRPPEGHGRKRKQRADRDWVATGSSGHRKLCGVALLSFAVLSFLAATWPPSSSCQINISHKSTLSNSFDTRLSCSDNSSSFTILLGLRSVSDATAQATNTCAAKDEAGVGAHA